ncbi:hypothetical protein TCAL_00528, partial [Tigriopus californicus]|eukprot:TCALIF_00528-PA protein Name:"Similar to Grid1 Glutamate receptor ionotropic, delta-1 (Rattus norvegicus)" AED:0.18 eAED:0.19 QI:1/1/0/1/1/1/2/0/570
MKIKHIMRVALIRLMVLSSIVNQVVVGKLTSLGERLPLIHVEHIRFCVWVQHHYAEDIAHLLWDSIPRIISDRQMPSRCAIGLINAKNDKALQISKRLIFDPSKTLIFLTRDLEQVPSFVFERNIHSIFIKAQNQSSFTFASPLHRDLAPYNPARIKSLKMTRFVNKKIKAVTFDLPPQSMLNFDTGVHRGFEYRIAAGVSSAVGLSLEVYAPEDGAWWGHETPPGSGNYTGLLGEFVTGSADIGWANLFYDHQRTRYMSFTDWYLSDQACFLVPKPKPYPKILALVWPFDRFTWLCTIFSVVIISIVVFVCLKSNSVCEASARNSSWGMLILSIVFKQSDLTVARIQHLGIRLLTMTLIVGMLLLGTSYGAGLISFLSINVHPEFPRTLDALNNYITTRNLEVSFCCDSMIDAIRDRQDSNVIKQKGKKEYNYSDPYRNVSKGTHVIPQSRQMLNFGIRTGLSNKLGQTNVFILDECFLSLPIALGLKKRSPIKPMLDFKLKQLSEAGLLRKWIQDEISSFGKLDKRSVNGARALESLTLFDMQGPFIVYGFAIGISGVIFLFEIVFKH